MTGALYLHDHPGYLAGTTGDISERQAATKLFVDNSSYASTTDLFVTKQGDDTQANTPVGFEGRGLSYAFGSLKAAAQKAQEIVGLPQPGDKIHVEDLINENETAFDNLADREKDVINLSRRKEILGHDLKDTEEKLISLGELKAKEDKDGFFDSAWSWLTGTFGLIGAIIFCVIAGPALLPIITQLIAWIVSRIPGLISWLGITSSQMTSNIIKGVHDAKERIRAVQTKGNWCANGV